MLMPCSGISSLNTDLASPRAAFFAGDTGSSHIYLPAVALAEMIMVVSKGRLPGIVIPELFDQLAVTRASTNYTFLPLLPETVIASHALTTIPDIFDRLVVVEAQRMGVPLLTRDTIIAASGLLTVVWD